MSPLFSSFLNSILSIFLSLSAFPPIYNLLGLGSISSGSMEAPCNNTAWNILAAFPSNNSWTHSSWLFPQTRGEHRAQGGNSLLRGGQINRDLQILSILFNKTDCLRSLCLSQRKYFLHSESLWICKMSGHTFGSQNKEENMNIYKILCWKEKGKDKH